MILKFCRQAKSSLPSQSKVLDFEGHYIGLNRYLPVPKDLIAFGAGTAY